MVPAVNRPVVEVRETGTSLFRQCPICCSTDTRVVRKVIRHGVRKTATVIQCLKCWWVWKEATKY